MIDMTRWPHIQQMSMGPLGNMHLVRLLIECPGCHRRARWFYQASEFDAWFDGAQIQDALKSSNASQREALLSGYCNQCLHRAAA